MEKTLFMIKPDWLQVLQENQIVSSIEGMRYSVAERSELILQRNDILQFWPEIKSEAFTIAVLDYLESKRVVLFTVEGNDCIREILSYKQTLRQAHWIWRRQVKTLVHSSDSADEFEREKQIVKTILKRAEYKIPEI